MKLLQCDCSLHCAQCGPCHQGNVVTAFAWRTRCATGVTSVGYARAQLDQGFSHVGACACMFVFVFMACVSIVAYA